MSNIYRDVTLNQVSEQDIGKTIRVAGWVENIRDHGGVSFIDLRDMYAVMQIVILKPCAISRPTITMERKRNTGFSSSMPMTTP